MHSKYPYFFSSIQLRRTGLRIALRAFVRRVERKPTTAKQLTVAQRRGKLQSRIAKFQQNAMRFIPVDIIDGWDNDAADKDDDSSDDGEDTVDLETDHSAEALAANLNNLDESENVGPGGVGPNLPAIQHSD